MTSDNNKKTLIGILASHDSEIMNNTLLQLLENLVIIDKDSDDQNLTQFMFALTGGTFDRVILGAPDPLTKIKVTRVNEDTRKYLLEDCRVVRLPAGINGGVIVLSCLVVIKIISLIWFFLSPSTAHLLKSDNLALMRLCDQWSVKRLMNWGSILEWHFKESHEDIKFNPQERLTSISLKEWPSNVPQVINEWLSAPDIIKNLLSNLPSVKTELSPKLSREVKVWEIDKILFSLKEEKVKIKYKAEKLDREINYIKEFYDKDRKAEKIEKDHKAEEIEEKPYYEKIYTKYYELEESSEPSKAKPITKEEEIEEIKKEYNSKISYELKTITLIAYDEMKERIVEFVIHYEMELGKFGRMVTTGNTGKIIQDAAPSLKNLIRCYSGPKGGDIEIATEILYKENVI